MKKKIKSQWALAFRILGLAGCVLFGLMIGALWYYQDGLPPTAELKNYTLRSGSEVYDSDGRMIFLFAYEKRKLVSVKELPPHLIDALISTEDKRFYSHFGVDPIRMARALMIDLRTGDFSQGASTITQQMARNMFLTLDKTISRKMREIVLAFKIEASFTKEEILEIYLNKIFWGKQNHGVETASLYYFNKHARDLSLPESALIVGMIQRPNYYDPFKHPERARERRDVVLAGMLKNGKITEEEYQLAVGSPINSQPGGTYARFASDYFIEHVRSIMESRYGTERLFEGGLKIYTTLDTEMSLAADSLFNAYLARAEGGFPNRISSVPNDARDIETKYIQGGMALIENETGYVRALIGGRSFEHSKFNRMTQAKRQPGSSIKPIYYTMAVSRGYHPAKILPDSPITIGRWSPKNSGGTYHGNTRMRVALQWSYNTWAVRCAQDIGLGAMNSAFDKFGLNIKANDLTAALGAYEVRPLDLIAAYTAFPNGGDRTDPIFVTKVLDMDGNLIESFGPQRHQVCSPQEAYIMTSMLQTVAVSGTGASSRSGYQWDSAGKTGTSNNNNDSWFIGFNKAYTLGIWTGFDNRNLRSGKALAASIWGPVMAQVIKIANNGRSPRSDDPRYSFNEPANIVHMNIDPGTGNGVSGGGIPEVFIKGNEPVMSANHQFFNFPAGFGFDDQFEGDL